MRFVSFKCLPGRRRWPSFVLRLGNLRTRGTAEECGEGVSGLVSVVLPAGLTPPGVVLPVVDGPMSVVEDLRRLRLDAVPRPGLRLRSLYRRPGVCGRECLSGNVGVLGPPVTIHIHNKSLPPRPRRSRNSPPLPRWSTDSGTRESGRLPQTSFSSMGQSILLRRDRRCRGERKESRVFTVTTSLRSLSTLSRLLP